MTGEKLTNHPGNWTAVPEITGQRLNAECAEPLSRITQITQPPAMNQNNTLSTPADHEHQTGGGSGEVSVRRLSFVDHKMINDPTYAPYCMRDGCWRMRRVSPTRAECRCGSSHTIPPNAQSQPHD